MSDLRQALRLVMERMFMPDRFVLRIDGDSGAVVDAARASLLRTEAGLQIDRVVSLEEAASRAIGGAGTNSLLVAVSATFGTLALLLASVGIYGVMSHLVARRTYEIGVRMALGARMRQVVQLVLWQGMRPALVGITVGLAGSLWATALIRGLLYEVAPQDPLTFAVVPIALVLVVIAACAAPARQATRIQPAAALRSDA